MEKGIERKVVATTGSESIKEMLADAMLEVLVEYFPVVNCMEQVEFEKYCLMMDAMTCDDCSQKRKGYCSGNELESMDEIITKCLMPGLVGENIKGMANSN